MPHAANKMSLEFFEHFIRTEVSRHPSLSAALQSKSNLRKCSQQFERAVTELHYRLIKAAVQQLFSRVSSARLQELSSAASSTCETKYVVTDSSPNTVSSQATDNEHVSSRWDAQSNNSQGLRPAPPRSPPRSQQQRNNDHSGSRRVKTEDPQPHYQQHQPQTQHHQCQHQQPPPEHHQQPCQPQQTHRPAPCPQPQQSASLTMTPPLPAAAPPPRPRPQPLMREGPTYNYPTAGYHNRLAMSSWYVANMDALLSNLMRLFELIYRDTLLMCGVGACDLRKLRNALPDPTLISMQQRASGSWRPNFMNCKIDFLLHIAAMVYRNTQDIRCGCQCSVPADPCWQPGVEPRRSNNQPPLRPPVIQPATEPTCRSNVGARWIAGEDGIEANRNNHTACECQYAITPPPPTPSPQQSHSQTFDGWDNNSNRANSASGCEKRLGKLKSGRHPLRRAVGRFSATVLSSSFSRSPSATSNSLRSRSSSNSSLTRDTDTGSTCFSVRIKVPL